MSATEILNERLSALDREIAAAEDYRSLLELTPRPPGLARLSRDLTVYLTAHAIDRRLQYLRGVRQATLACAAREAARSDRRERVG
ncbi:Hypothetical Protein RradSPS_2304 [Rubrobacter radiotolerans]|uniref:Uncharacterized protein n=1 Tax=Rubrobacter radiotolerans TaxID=42256 RepID=A0A023X569_RUBRA|nr:hypothetical protein [Rubrobacter radiotolerans]AHY47587.1 Hypothetical Protein RradSPS_2304 [Rubrobacter radiotolerans]MDX5894992.1 hypothetical protein [Rubrobacter radiotolerans]SMC07229.1 histidine kinase [Rubrobacter radiotolerans DSM 5868]